MKKTELQKIAEEYTGQPLKFLHYGMGWTFGGGDLVVKVADRSLEYAVKISSYLENNDFPALAPRDEFVKNGYYFYVYTKGQDGLFRSDVSDWLGKALHQLHQLKIPSSLKVLTFKEMNGLKLALHKSGYDSLPTEVQRTVMQKLEKAFSIPNMCLNHGDPNQDNVVKLNGKFVLIDWDIAMLAPNEYDIAVIKYAELFGRDPSESAQIVRDFGTFNQEKVSILIDAIAAISLVWFAHNINQGYFGDNGELERRIAGVMGDKSIQFSLDYPVYG